MNSLPGFLLEVIAPVAGGLLFRAQASIVPRLGRSQWPVPQ